METQDPFLVSACEFVGIYTCVWTDAHVCICRDACVCVCSHTEREKIWALVLFCGSSETSAPSLLKRDLWENSTLDSTVLSVYQQGITS